MAERGHAVPACDSIAPRLIDTHCHLQASAFDGIREAVLERALSELAAIVVVGDTPESSAACVAMADARVFAAVGLHPHHADEAGPAALDMLRSLAVRPGVVAWGEIGLDYHYEFSSRERQRAAFREQLECAAVLGLPVIVHCREAEEDLATILDSLYRALSGGVMHCFGGDADFAGRCLDWGFHVSFAGNVTYPKSERLRAAARVVPLDRLLIETDSPYLSPQPVRGIRPCEPIFVRHTAAFLAQWRGECLERLALETARNAVWLFGLAL